MFTWEPLNVAGLSYKCSLNGGTQVDCEFVGLQSYLTCAHLPHPPPYTGSPPLSVRLVDLACGENCLEVEAILDGLTVGSHVLCQSESLLMDASHLRL